METNMQQTSQHRVEERDSVVIRFTGDSGDGIQVTGTQFTHESALAGNDIATLPNFPAEIRAPAGTLAGVSGFQINFGRLEINTPGDSPDVLVAFNPAAYKSNIRDLKRDGILIINEDTFTEKYLSKLGISKNPSEDEEVLSKYRVYSIPISKLTREALASTLLTPREIERCKNFFALGVMLWMFQRKSESTLNWIQTKYAKNPALVEANTLALKAGITYAEATEVFEVSYIVKPAIVEGGIYRSLTGSVGLAYGLVSASLKSGLPLYLGAYPITPASDLLHELAKHKNLGVTTFQAEDEIAAICFAIGASFAGKLAITSSSGPGIALKSEALGLAVMTELPLVVINIQRAGPSTGLPTKTEQADLFQAMYGRAGEAPVCVLAASSPKSAYTMAYEACRIALKYMTPVILLSDGFINNTAEPWKIPDPKDLKKIDVQFTTTNNNKTGGQFLPYLRDESTLARPWAVPGTPDLMHRIGGLEKEDKTGNVCYEPDNHALMCKLRAEKIARIAQEISPTTIDGDTTGNLLIIGWGGTEGAIKEATRISREQGKKVSRIHLFYLNPLPPDLKSIISNFKNILIPENNSGQLRSIIRDRFLVDAHGLNVINGLPLKVSDTVDAITKILQG
jgi:2-oxoglutarate/2-oxoacid ferredoxin oxidoreductase subunit alpha